MVDEANAAPERVNPRTRRVQRVILDAAVEVLLQQGASEVTANRVADRADVARTTVYRHWPDQRSLLLATIDTLTEPHHHEERRGPLVDDLQSVLGQLRMRLVVREVRSVFGALAAFASGDDAFADAQRRFVEQLTQPTLGVLKTAQDRGELSEGVDVAAEATLLVGPLLHQHLVLFSEMPDGFVERVVERWLVVHGLR